MVIPVLNQGDQESQDLAKKLQLPLVDETPQDYYLVFDDSQLWVRNGALGENFKLAPLLQEEWERLAQQKISLKKDLLCRALGFKGQKSYCVLDGTMGFAMDSIHLLSFGMQVIGCEQNPLVFSLVENSLEHMYQRPEAFQIFLGKTSDYLASLNEPIHVLYLDPMFEDIKKKSAPKKNLAFLRALSLHSCDVQRVIEASWMAGIKRVVVKRPLNSENLYGKPNVVLSGKLIRYDVYLK